LTLRPNDSENTRLYAAGGIGVGSPTGGSKGAGTVNIAGAYYVGGAQLASLNLADVVGWTNYTPTLTAGSGSFTSASVTGRYLKIGKLVHFTVGLSVTTVGTASSFFEISLPFTSGSVQNFAVAGRDSANGNAFIGVIDTGSTQLVIQEYNGGFGLVAGSSLNMTGFYESST
jgi:hypothetical protein